MNILINIILTYTVIFICLLVGVPGTDKTNILQNKLILFIGIFLLKLFLSIINKLNNKCAINIKRLSNHSVLNALISIVGYSIYIDLITMANTKNMFQSIQESNLLRSALISGIISTSMFSVDLIKILLGSALSECNSYQELSY